MANDDLIKELDVTKGIKEEMADAINSKGVGMPADTPLDQYANYIKAITPGEGLTSVVSDGTLKGLGTVTSPLSIKTRPKFQTSITLPVTFGSIVSIPKNTINPPTESSGMRQGDILCDLAGTLSYVTSYNSVNADISVMVYLGSQMSWDYIDGNPKNNTQFLNYVGNTSEILNATIVDTMNDIYGEIEALVHLAEQING